MEQLQPPSAASAFHAAFRAVAPNQEYLLQGSVLDSHYEVLLHRLRGLCDSADTSPELFSDYEAVYQLKNTAQQSQYILFRVRQSLTDREAPCYIRYLGQAEVGLADKNRHTLVRACFDVACSNNVREFLNELGFKLDHEYVAKGYFFHKGRMKVTVSKLYRMQHPGKTDQNNLEPIWGSHLVELSVVAPMGQESIGEDMKNFAEQLKPLCILEKVDHRRLP